MEFDWRRAIDRNSEALCVIAARLIVMAGIQAGRKVETLPRHLYLRILALLRPAEFAARRLIAMAACKLDLRVPQVRPRSAVSDRDAADQAPSSGPTGHLLPRGEKEGRAAFALFDPFKPFGPPWLEPDACDTPAARFRPALPPNEPVAAKTLCRRIRALADALSDLDGQALRLARWRARRRLETCRPRRWSPMRPGRPPGYRKRPKTPMQELLKECHLLALEAWNTS